MRAQQPAVVTHVIDGTSMDTRLADGRGARIRLIGVDAPLPAECGGGEALRALERLVEGRSVTLVADPVVPPTDELGRYQVYVDRSDGIDAGEEMLANGWADLLEYDEDFARLARYRIARSDGKDGNEGVWERCDGNFHWSRADERRARQRSAERFLRAYYRRVSRRRFRSAWRMLGRSVRRDIGSFSRWKAGHRRSLGVSVRSARARLLGRRAVVSVSLRSRDRDACSGRVVRQRFRGKWLLAPRGDGWVAQRVRIRKTAGRRVRIDRSECSRPRRRRGAPRRRPPTNCQGYSPCLPPGPDVDCQGGGGNGPRFVDGPVSVRGSDPYGLDRDGDGTGCDS